MVSGAGQKVGNSRNVHLAPKRLDPVSVLTPEMLSSGGTMRSTQAIKVFVDFFVVESTCGFNMNLLSSTTPRLSWPIH